MANVLVTEATSEIGATIAVGLAANGFQVIAASPSGAFPSGDGGGLGIVPIELDLRDPGSITSAVAEAAEIFPGIDVVVANGVVGTFSPFELLAEEKLTDTLEVNLVGQLRLLQAVVPHLRQSDRGRILGISSTVGMLGLPGGVAPCAARAGFEVALSALRQELVRFGIKVSVVEASPQEQSAYGLPWVPAPGTDRTYVELAKAVSDFGCHVEPPATVVQTIRDALTAEDPLFRYTADGSYGDLAEEIRTADPERAVDIVEELFQLT